MSRSNPTASSHPCKRWLDWKGGQGKLAYWNKAGNPPAEVIVPLPFTFLALDELSTVTGWNDLSQSGIVSNEIRNTQGAELVVRSFKGGHIVTGFYRNIKGEIKAAGGKYTKNLYIACKDETGALILGSLKLSGAALRSWMEFSQANRAALYEGAVTLTGSVQGKKGSVTFYSPVFEAKATSAETDAAAKRIDAELQKFLASYLANTAGPVSAPEPEVDDEPDYDDPPHDDGPPPF